MVASLATTMATWQSSGMMDQPNGMIPDDTKATSALNTLTRHMPEGSVEHARLTTLVTATMAAWHERARWHSEVPAIRAR